MAKILIAEDDTLLRPILVELLEMDQHEVVIAHNGASCLNLAQKHLPDLILCDMGLGDMSGSDVLDVLRNSEATARIPFIFLTATTDQASIHVAMNAGADDYITKPFQARQLLETVNVWLEYSRSVRVR